MNNSRLQRFRKRRKFIFVSKIIAIWYMAIISIVYFSSSTGAYFNVSKINTATIQAGEWWDKSNLVFVRDNQGVDVYQSCKPVEISAIVKNDSNIAMIGSTEYEVHHHLKKEPEKGESTIVGSGTINPLNGNESITLTLTADQEGDYQFKVFQRPGYNDNYENRTAIWDRKIKVNCQQGSNVNSEEEVINKDENLEVEENPVDVPEHIENEELSESNPPENVDDESQIEEESNSDGTTDGEKQEENLPKENDVDNQQENLEEQPEEEQDSTEEGETNNENQTE
ncbi:TasA anchoring/assembly protein [Salirhabdus euzebyi]|uniref:TasA anchoring/assembly protein n=1 Tax=Salirhabdus euzebyi TaxID=394506 RepID=A0A841Q5M6_9BACI|nr:amyloid fiber anchoring/assembly protein TapA [Salirhabdus euzebyi]MBB6453684.1 TasA anchoring/assembly protein [Salirhabdus euzebyi]